MKKALIQFLPSLAVLLFGNDIATLKLIDAFTVFVVMDILSGSLKALYQKNVQSRIWLKGITKKILMYVVIAVAYQVDKLHILGTLNLEVSATTFYLLGEIISIFENVKAMGVSVPTSLTDITEKVSELENSVNSNSTETQQITENLKETAQTNNNQPSETSQPNNNTGSVK